MSETSSGAPIYAAEEKARKLAEHPWMAYERVQFRLPLKRAEEFAARCSSASLGQRFTDSKGEETASISCDMLDEPTDAQGASWCGESDF